MTVILMYKIAFRPTTSERRTSSVKKKEVPSGFEPL